MCVFCKIIAGEIPSERLYEDDDMINLFADFNENTDLDKIDMFKEEEEAIDDEGLDFGEDDDDEEIFDEEIVFDENENDDRD